MMKRIGFGRISCGRNRLDLQNKLKVVCDYSADVGSPQNKSMPEMYFHLMIGTMRKKKVRKMIYS